MADVKDPVEVLRNYLDDVGMTSDEETALRELERRARVERRLEAWLGEPGTLRVCNRSTLGVKLISYRDSKEWCSLYDGASPDCWTAADAALDAAGAPKESE